MLVRPEFSHKCMMHECMIVCRSEHTLLHCQALVASWFTSCVCVIVIVTLTQLKAKVHSLAQQFTPVMYFIIVYPQLQIISILLFLQPINLLKFQVTLGLGMNEAGQCYGLQIEYSLKFIDTTKITSLVNMLIEFMIFDRWHSIINYVITSLVLCRCHWKCFNQNHNWPQLQITSAQVYRLSTDFDFVTYEKALGMRASFRKCGFLRT